MFSLHFNPLEEASVVATSYSSNNWTFSTAWTPEDLYHPVSGNRMFGAVDNGNGTATFYTRGVDRISTRLNVAIDFLALDIYASGGEIWENFQQNLKNAFGSSARIQAPVVYRPKYAEIRAVLSSGARVSSINGC